MKVITVSRTSFNENHVCLMTVFFCLHFRWQVGSLFCSRHHFLNSLRGIGQIKISFSLSLVSLLVLAWRELGGTQALEKSALDFWDTAKCISMSCADNAYLLRGLHELKVNLFQFATTQDFTPSKPSEVANHR